MKTLFPLIFCLMVFRGVGISQSCLPQGIIFTTQNQIDSFPINHPNCTQIEGNVTIWSNGIINLNGLNSITTIGGYLNISYCNSLTTLTGLDNLTYVGGSVTIYNCTSLSSLTGLENLTSTGGYLSIYSCTFLTNLTGIDNLITIGDDFTIGGCDSLTSLTGLNNLASIEGSFFILLNNVLTSLIGLDNLTNVGNQLWISDNDDLLSLSGLDSINANSISNLWIFENPSLSTCAVQSICDYLTNPNGTIEIYNNAQGCNNQQQIEAACAAIGVESLTPEPSLTISPNPTSNTITIETPSKGSFTILNLDGQQLLQQEITELTTTVDVSGLISGIYVVKLVGEKGVRVGKFVKQ